jgi:NitT/TauT family transport system substrate-binding protein
VRSRKSGVRLLVAFAVTLVVGLSGAEAAKLKIGYSDWPGWVAWEIGVQKGWFAEAGVDVEFVWFEYVPSMDAFAAGQIDAVCMTNGDALVTGATGKRSKAILINDYSNGNDMVVARPGIRKVEQLKGKKVGVELGFVGHLLLLKALEAHGLQESDVELVNMPTHETPQALASKGVDAIVAWQPNSGEALKMVAGSRPVYSSADSPGIIYDLLYVSNESLAQNGKDWEKVAGVWYRIADYIRDEANRADVLKIMSARVGLAPDEYAPFMKGTYIMNLAESAAAFKDMSGFKSVYGSSRIVDEFNVANKVYETPEPIADYLEPKFVKALMMKKK